MDDSALADAVEAKACVRKQGTNGEPWNKRLIRSDPHEDTIPNGFTNELWHRSPTAFVSVGAFRAILAGSSPLTGCALKSVAGTAPLRR